jgi:hypothetical protein
MLDGGDLSSEEEDESGVKVDFKSMQEADPNFHDDFDFHGDEISLYGNKMD